MSIKSKKKNILTSIIIVLSIVAFLISILCFIKGFWISGFAILISFMIIDICLIIMKLQQNRLKDMQSMKERGNLLNRYKCDLTMNDIDYENGYLVCYENGFSYEHDDVDIGFVKYYESILKSVENGIISMQLSTSKTDIYFKSNKMLRIKVIISHLLNHNVNLDHMTFNVNKLVKEGN